MVTNGLSESSVAAAFRSETEEYAWRPRDVAAALLELERSGMAVLGGEVWLVQNGVIHATVPTPEGVRAVVTWEASRAAGESWPAFVARAAAHARTAIASIMGSSIPASVPPEEVHFNLTWVSQFQHAALRGAG